MELTWEKWNKYCYAKKTKKIRDKPVIELMETWDQETKKGIWVTIAETPKLEKKLKRRNRKKGQSLACSSACTPLRCIEVKSRVWTLLYGILG